VGGEAPVTPVLSLDSSYLNPSYKPCDNRSYYNNRHDQSTMGIDPMNNISIIIRILFAVTIFQQYKPATILLLDLAK
jgi:hypothetical protein